MSSLTIKNAVVIPITAAEKSFDGYVGVKEWRFNHGEFLTDPRRPFMADLSADFRRDSSC
jgi:hypothetical protein